MASILLFFLLPSELFLQFMIKGRPKGPYFLFLPNLWKRFFILAYSWNFFMKSLSKSIFYLYLTSKNELLSWFFLIKYLRKGLKFPKLWLRSLICTTFLRLVPFSWESFSMYTELTWWPFLFYPCPFSLKMLLLWLISFTNGYILSSMSMFSLLFKMKLFSKDILASSLANTLLYFFFLNFFVSLSWMQSLLFSIKGYYFSWFQEGNAYFCFCTNWTWWPN